MTDPTLPSVEDRAPTPAAGQASMAPKRSDVASLLLVLVALGSVLQAATYAHFVASATGGMAFSVDPTTGVQADIDWEQFLLAFAAQVSFLPAIVLAVAVLAVGHRPWADLPASARAAAWIAFPLGLVIAAASTYAFAQGLFGDQAIFAFGGEPSGPFTRLGSSAPAIASAALAGHASWGAFGLLPIARPAGDEAGGEPDDGAGDGWAPPPAPLDRG